MTNFEYFREQCQETEKFLAHILYKDSTFQIIENEKSKLLSINEDDVFYFEAAWWRLRYEKSLGSFRRFSTLYTHQYDNESWCMPYYHWILGYFTICCNLFKMGITDFELLDSIMLQIYSNYLNKLSNDKKNHKKLKEEWEEFYRKWKNDPLKTLVEHTACEEDLQE